MGRNRKKYQRAIKRLFREISKFSKNLTSNFVRWLLRVFLASPQHRWNKVQSGFVLPTATLLLLVVSLVVAALLIRTVNRTEQVAGERATKIIMNTTTPAIERAKAKLEYLFKNDERLPNGVPSEDFLLAMMRNEDIEEEGEEEEALEENPYDFPDETRLDINDDGTIDNAWSFRVDLNGDGQVADAPSEDSPDGTIAYSVIWNTPTDLEALKDLSQRAVADRADALQVRHGPFFSSQFTDPEFLGQCELPEEYAPPIERGWFSQPGTTATIRKNFQINAVLIPDNPNTTTAATLEMHQDRQSDRGNKWGAWFRNDLEVFPGPAFRWNGAMHTEGSIITFNANNDPNQGFQAYLMTSPSSCLFTPEASEITLNEVTEEINGQAQETFQGQLVHASVDFNQFGTSNAFEVAIHPYSKNVADLPPSTPSPLLANGANGDNDVYTDSVNDDDDGPVESPANVMLNPLDVFTKNISRARGQTGELYPNNYRDGNWANTQFNSGQNPRVKNDSVQQPYVDDTYRADDRFGPQPAYGIKRDLVLPNGENDSTLGKSGEPISDIPNLTRMEPEADNPEDVGLDGYWERRAANEGLRVIVGQRLELGDPLDPPDDDITHIIRQQRSLRDNPSAVQATAIYHHTDEDGQFPIAAIASTVHPGTPDTLKQSATFETLGFNFKVLDAATAPNINTLLGTDFGDDNSEIAVDFFNGIGTNGWEFEVPDAASFPSTELSRAIVNLANFSGDIDGAFPPVQDDTVHPYPPLIQWGDFSNLRRALDTNAGNDSIADNTYQQTAGLTLGMLAYNISYLNAFDYENDENKGLIYDPTDDPDNNTIENLDEAIQTLSNGNPVDGGTDDGEVIYFPSEEMDGNGNCTAAEALNGGTCNPIDDPIPNITIFPPGVDTISDDSIIRIPTTQLPGRPTHPTPEAYLVGLEALLEDDPNNADLQTAVKLAKLIALKEQVKRDRKFGFKPSPSGFNAVDSDSYGAAPSTLFGAENAPLGSYRYVVRFVKNGIAPNGYDIDLNNNGSFNDTIAVSEIPDLLDSAQPSEDFNRNGVLDFAVSIDLNGNGELSDFEQDLDGDGEAETVSEDFYDAELGELVDEDDNPDSSDDPDRMLNAPTVRILQELNDNIVDDEIAESALGWDLNNDGDTEDTFTEISEDLNGNNELDPPPYGGVTYYPGVMIDVGCDFSDPENANASGTGNNFFGFGDPADADDPAAAEKRFIRLATALCSAQPKYPSLYYIFPQDTHGHGYTSGGTGDVDLDGDGDVDEFDQQPPGEDLNFNGTLDLSEDTDGDDELDENSYLEDTEIQTINSDTELYEALTDEEIAAIALKPKPIDEWELPYSETIPSDCTENARPNCSQYNLVKFVDPAGETAETDYRVAFKDTAMFDGREKLNVRVMNADLEMLTNQSSANQQNGTADGSDPWISNGSEDFRNAGIVYSFREDAVREDGVARPASTTWSAYESAYPEVASGSRMNAQTLQDPPVNINNNISPKPIDFYPDPDRRPYGFRVINGSTLERETDVLSGMTFVSDNSVYIKGNLNCHGDCDNQMEEFNQELTDNFSNFYTRSSLNNSFANPESDPWRPTEIIADAVGILSDQFCDGSLADGFVNVGTNSPNIANNLDDWYGCDTNAQFTSYLTQNRPITAPDTWIVENPLQTSVPAGTIADRYEIQSPVKISNNGRPLCTGTICDSDTQEYDRTNDAAYVPRVADITDQSDKLGGIPSETWVNALIISGTIPSRPGQSNGGFHNFPRLLEDWKRNNTALNISGSLLQLSFSTSATAPFVQEAWEPGEDPSVPPPTPWAEVDQFYRAPQRRWGYDVGLQFLPPAPVTQRLLAVGNARSEFYSEPEINDPYITQLYCTINSSAEVCD